MGKPEPYLTEWRETLTQNIKMVPFLSAIWDKVLDVKRKYKLSTRAFEQPKLRISWIGMVTNEENK